MSLIAPLGLRQPILTFRNFEYHPRSGTPTERRQVLGKKFCSHFSHAAIETRDHERLIWSLLLKNLEMTCVQNSDGHDDSESSNITLTQVGKHGLTPTSLWKLTSEWIAKRYPVTDLTTVWLIFNNYGHLQKQLRVHLKWTMADFMVLV